MIAIKDYKAIYEYRERRQNRIDGKRLDDEWKTIKGTHVMVDDEGSISKGPERLRNLSSKKGKNLTNIKKAARSYDKWASELSNEEKDAVRKYVALGHSRMFNDKLRTGKDATRGQASPDEYKALDSALEKSTIPEEMTLYRGTSEKMFGGRDPKDMIGETIVDNGYESTSMTGKVGGIYSDGVVCEINAPKGSKGAYVDEVGFGEKSDFGEDANNEILLPRNSKFKITGVETDSSGRTVVKMDYLGQREELSVGKEMSPINSDYAYEDGDTEDDFTHKNIKKLKPIYDEYGIEACHDEWYKFRMADSTKDIHQISKDEADEVMYDNVRQSIYDGWFRAADSSYKPQLTDAVVKNPEMRNAALNLAYENYRNNTDNPLPFEEFLVTPIKMYRGEKGQKHVEDDIFDAYTFDKKMASHFAGSNGTVTETSIRPIDTYGSMRAVGEAEIWVPRQLSPVGYKGDSREDGITWERFNPIKWALEDYKEEDDGCEDLLDSIIQEAEIVKLFDGSSKESDRLTMHRCIESIQIMVLQLTAKIRPQHEDSAFFDGELNSNLGDRNILYPEVEAFRERRKKRLDARADEEGRWVTTEEKHKIHLNEEGVPDKGNPHVIATMKGEGKNPRTRAEVITARVKKKSAKIKELAKRVDDANEAHENAIDEKMKADKALTKAERGLRRAKSHKEFITGLGFKEGDKNKIRKESDDLQIQMDKLRDNRPVFKLNDEEKAKYTELESRKNQVDYASAVYDECFGPDAFTREKVAKAREQAKAADEKMRQAEKEYRQARKEFKQKAKSGDIDKAKLMTDEERSAAISKISSGSGWGDMSERQKNQAIDALKNASDAEIQLIEKSFDGVSVVDGQGRRSRGVSGSTAWYTRGTGVITMDQEHMEKPETMWHEYGHYLDDPESSGMSAGTTKLLGTVYKNSLSQSVVDAKILHNDAAAKDVQRILDEEASGRFRVESSGGNMLRVFDTEKGEYVDDSADMSWEYHLSQAFSKRSMEYRAKDKEYEDFLKSIGYPTEDEVPKRSDYIESYTTPKRGIRREREKFKGAEEEYHNKLVEYNERVEKALSEHGDEYYEQRKAYEKRIDERNRDVADASDIMDGIMRGQGPWAVWGSHGKDYYAEMSAPAKEAVANYHQMRVMGRTGGIEFLRSLVPSVVDGLESAYNEWLWRNVDV